MGAGLLLVAGCDEAKVDTALFESVKQCTSLGFAQQECEANYGKAQQMHADVAPKYMSRTDCEADFGAEKCEIAPQRAQSGGSIFMPLMAGYMMGSLLNSRAQTQPLYRTAGDSSNFRTADNKNIGSAIGRTQIAQSATQAPAARTRTVSRGGFGASARRSAGG